MVLKRSCENVDVIKDVYPNLRRLSMVSEHTQDSTIEKNAGFSKIVSKYNLSNISDEIFVLLFLTPM